MEKNAKKSLVVFAIGQRPLQGVVDMTNLRRFTRLHTVRARMCETLFPTASRRLDEVALCWQNGFVIIFHL